MKNNRLKISDVLKAEYLKNVTQLESNKKDIKDKIHKYKNKIK